MEDMRIMILDDDLEARTRLERLVEYWMTKEHQEIFRVRTYGDAASFLEAFRARPAEIVFLDILLEKDVNGIGVAAEVRELAPECVIFFTTGTPEYAVDGFAVHALHYCVKPIRPIDIAECMRRAQEKLHWAERSIDLRISAQTIPVPLRDITYVESELHDLIVHRANGKAPLRTRMTMTEAEAIFTDRCFLRIGRSFLVNMDAIREARGDVFVLTNGTELPLRRQGRAELRRIYETYRYQKMRE
ncbi:LytTR family DNA-binding domain-containing protein [uncultured Selenomonas sp.]|uniref:LytR/AlgR family response regulator transcription factor n=1 Tax=uncultured Selenomonas sp. TaxID=159275 RepID=UPI0025F93586|nr:LytTR family DNA-binding domain-containing protein [uncultured Selenomonas sp.]